MTIKKKPLPYLDPTGPMKVDRGTGEQLRWVLVCQGQPVDHEHMGVMFDSKAAAESVRDDVNTQTTTGQPLEVVEVTVRRTRFFGRDAWALVG